MPQDIAILFILNKMIIMFDGDKIKYIYYINDIEQKYVCFYYVMENMHPSV